MLALKVVRERWQQEIRSFPFFDVAECLIGRVEGKVVIWAGRSVCAEMEKKTFIRIMRDICLYFLYIVSSFLGEERGQDIKS